MGGGSVEGGSAGDSRGAGALRNYFGAPRRGARKDAAAVQTGRRRQARQRAAVDVVGDPRRWRRDFALRDGRRSGKGRPERGLGEGRNKCCSAATGAEHRVHQSAREGAAPPGALPRSGVCAAPSARRNGRRAAVIQPARGPAKVRTTWLSVCAFGFEVSTRNNSCETLNRILPYFCALIVTETRSVCPVSGSVDKRFSEVCPSLRMRFWPVLN